MASYNLSPDAWKTVGSWYGTKGKQLNIWVGTRRQCKWRKRTAGVTLSSGKFTSYKKTGLFNQSIQVKSPVQTTCDTAFGG